MFSRNRWNLRRWRWSLPLMLAAAGCSSQQSTEQRIKIALEQSGMQATPLYQLGGTVTIDGQPPTFADNRKKHLVVMLYNPARADIPIARHLHTLVGEDGSFRFTQDGISPGHYVLLFAVLRRKGPGNFVGPDALNNLYNDPDVNAKNFPEFVIDHQKPGKTDYQFDLATVGKEPVKTASPHAMTAVK